MRPHVPEQFEAARYALHPDKQRKLLELVAKQKDRGKRKEQRREPTRGGPQTLDERPDPPELAQKAYKLNSGRGT